MFKYRSYLAARTVAVCCLFLINFGCAPIISSRAVDQDEKLSALEILRTALSRQGACRPLLDTQVVVSFDSFLRSGTLTGYLLAGAPAKFSFVALGPMEQPVLFMSSSGNEFQLVVVPEGKAYLGKTSGETFQKYAPPGLKANSLFYWFIGGMEPGSLKVDDVRAPKEGSGFWYDIHGSDAGELHRIFIDPDVRRITRHLLFGPDGKLATEVRYQWSKGQICCLPAVVTIEAAKYSLKLKLSFSECKAVQSINGVNFTPSIPPFYHKVHVP